MPSISFVLCVESGELEALTVRAAESLRRSGGRLSDAPVLAVTPRRGPRLSRWTRRRFGELGVEHVRVNDRRDYSWYHYLNKPVALRAAEGIVETELVAFLDSDTLVLGEPASLLLEDGVDFTACISDIELGGTTGPGHPSEEGWRRVCELAGTSVDHLPWVEAPLDRVRMRLYFNSGVMAYRRSKRLGALQLDLLTRVFEEGVQLDGSATRMLEQVVLAPLAVARGIAWQALPFSHNTAMISYTPYVPDHLREAVVLHYHDSMSPSRWAEFMARMEVERPESAEWLRAAGPIVNPARYPQRAAGEVLRIARGVRRRAQGLALRGA